MTLREEIISAFTRQTVSSADIAMKAQEMEYFVTAGVDYLRSEFPNDHIRYLMSIVWDLIRNKITPFALGPNVPTLSLAIVGRKSDPSFRQPAIFAPINWLDMIEKDHVYQMGALVFIGSQAVDYHNNRLLNDPAVARQRSYVYEAEYCHTVKNLTPSWQPNANQEHMMKEYPAGLKTPAIKELIYQPRPFSKV